MFYVIGWTIAIALVGVFVGLLFYLRWREGAIFKKRWIMDDSTGRKECPCCHGGLGHMLGDPDTTGNELAPRGVYSAANWIECTVCNGYGHVLTGLNYTYQDYQSMSCAGRP